jgi:hypothetical protein
MIYNIPEHRRGDTWDGINSIALTQNGQPVNLSGALVKMEFRLGIDDPVALTLSTENGSIQVISPGLSSVRILPRIIEIPFAKYYYDLQVTYPTGIVKTYITGTWPITPDYTA